MRRNHGRVERPSLAFIKLNAPKTAVFAAEITRRFVPWEPIF